MSSTKNILSLALAGIILFPSLFIAFHSGRIALLNLQLEHRLESELTETIMVNPESIIWLSENDEALINGELFDVKSMRLKEGRLELNGFFDREEKEAINRLSFQSKEQNKLWHSAQILFLPLFCENNLNELPERPEISLKTILASEQSDVVNAIMPVSCPPPDQI